MDVATTISAMPMATPTVAMRTTGRDHEAVDDLAPRRLAIFREREVELGIVYALPNYVGTFVL